MELSFSGNVNYLPPGGSSNTNSPLAASATYGAQALATIDVPSGTASGTSIAVGFGSVANPVGFVVKNTMPSGGVIGINLNGSGQGTGMVSIEKGGFIALGQPNAGPGGIVKPLVGATIYVLTTTTYAGTIEVMVMGD